MPSTPTLRNNELTEQVVEVQGPPKVESGILVVPLNTQLRQSMRLGLTPDRAAEVELEPGEEYQIENARVWLVEQDVIRGGTIELENFLEETTAEVCEDCGGQYVLENDREDLPDLFGEAVNDLPSGVYLLETPEYSQEMTERDAARSNVDDWNTLDLLGNRETPFHIEWDPRYRFVCRDCGHSTPWSSSAKLLERIGKQDAFQEWREPVLRSSDIVAASSELETLESRQSMACGEPLGMATGGSKDATNFREQIEEGYTPSPDALQYEGLFYDYYFETTGETSAADHQGLFYPAYSTSVTDHPITGETERFVSVGLNSTLSTDDFDRKPLNLVAVLDVSGSMDSPFEQYHYDENDRSDPGDTSKIEAAREALAGLTTHLEDDDRLGVVLYNSTAGVAKPLRDVGSTDMDAIRGHIREIAAGGSTNLESGFQTAVDLLMPHADDVDPTKVENRIIFMTDMMPNVGRTDEADLIDLVQGAADEGIFTTFLGVGLDANASLTDPLSSVRGANHYFINSAEEFQQRLDDEFEYMVTPLVFDLELTVASKGYEVVEAYGAPDADPASGQITNVATLFPSPTRDGETRGGVTLLRLEQQQAESSLTLTASWEERDGSKNAEAVDIELESEPEHFDHDGIRKAVLLTRYGRLLRDWTSAVHDSSWKEEGGVDDWQGSPGERNEWEHQSTPLVVPSEYATQFDQLHAHFATERDALGDDDLEQEVPVFETLLDEENRISSPTTGGDPT
jgi:Ca-activated chloride channel family protein